MKIPRPMKGIDIPADAIEETLEELLKYHGYLYASVKLDGYHYRVFDNKPWSTKPRVCPNLYIQRKFAEANLPDGFDGELLVRGDNFQATQSGITSEDGEPDFEFHVFDWIAPTMFSNRYDNYNSYIHAMPVPDWLHCVSQLPLYSLKDILEFEASALLLNYEGIMLRSPRGLYKEGRSTLTEGWLMKLKRFADAEAKIIGFNEGNTNLNAEERSAYGLTKRAAIGGNKMPSNTLGSFVCIGQFNGVPTQFNVGTGLDLTQELRAKIWDDQDQFLGRTITYKYQVKGSDVRPRSPIFKCFRNEGE